MQKKKKKSDFKGCLSSMVCRRNLISSFISFKHEKSNNIESEIKFQVICRTIRHTT